MRLAVGYSGPAEGLTEFVRQFDETAADTKRALGRVHHPAGQMRMLIQTHESCAGQGQCRLGGTKTSANRLWLRSATDNLVIGRRNRKPHDRPIPELVCAHRANRPDVESVLEDDVE